MVPLENDSYWFSFSPRKSVSKGLGLKQVQLKHFSLRWKGKHFENLLFPREKKGDWNKSVKIPLLTPAPLTRRRG